MAAAAVLVEHNRALPIERRRPPSLVLPAAGPWSPGGGVRWPFVHVRVWVKQGRGHEAVDVVDPDGVRLDDGLGAGHRGGLLQRVRAASSSLRLDAVAASASVYFGR